MVLSRMHCNVEFYDVGKIPHTGIGRRRTSDVVLRHRNTVVRGKCGLPSALLVFSALGCARVNLAKSNVSCPSHAGSVTSKLMTIALTWAWKHVAGKPCHGKTPHKHAYCIQADNISALFLVMTHEYALLLAADQPPLLRCFAWLHT